MQMKKHGITFKKTKFTSKASANICLQHPKDLFGSIQVEGSILQRDDPLFLSPQFFEKNAWHLLFLSAVVIIHNKTAVITTCKVSKFSVNIVNPPKTV